MLKNTTPYTAERTWVLDRDASKIWVVVVKATFDILPNGETTLSEKQEDPLLACQYFGEPGKSSLIYEADLLPSKTSTDVVLNGYAYAPKGKSVRRLTVEMSVGKNSKHAVIFGDRYWTKRMLGGLSMSKPEPFERLPIIYEHAYGGWDSRSQDTAKLNFEPRNPVGKGFATRRKHIVDQPLPNIEDPHNLISSWKDRPHPMGFSAIASFWSPRREYAGTYDANWQKDRFPLLPTDFDERFYRFAPDDQQTQGFLLGGESVRLINLSDNGVMNFLLPKVRLTFKTRFGHDKVEHRAKLQSVILEPDIRRMLMVWATYLKCPTRKIDQLDETIIGEKSYVSLGRR